MHFDDIFRSFFGFRRPNLPRDLFEYDADSETSDDDFFWDFLPPDAGHPSFGPMPGEGESTHDIPAGFHGPDAGVHFGLHSDPADLFRHFDDMVRGFEEMFQTMGVVDFPRNQMPSVPAIEAPPSSSASEGKSLRERMLKDSDLAGRAGSPIKSESTPQLEEGVASQKPQDKPFGFGLFGGLLSPRLEHPSPRKQEDRMDRDLDDELKHGGSLTDILQPPQQTPSTSSPHPLPDKDSVFRALTVRTYRRADGKVEEQKTVHDGRGREESVVTRRIGDQAHTVTTRRNPRGNEEIIENFHNIDEKDQADFERRWESRDETRDLPPTLIPHAPLDHGTGKIFKNLFERGFPGFWKGS